MIKVKICGLSREADIDAVNHVLPDFVGFVFAPSRRRVDSATAAMLRKKLDARIRVVGVFVNEDMGNIIRMYKNGNIDLAQLHGDEDGEYIKRLRESCGCGVIKAIGVGDTLPPLPKEPDYLLFDALSRQRGGAGKVFDWNILQAYHGLPYFLAGGLGVDNVSGVLNALSPFCIDVSSGVETDGAKDGKKIENFVHLVRRNSK